MRIIVEVTTRNGAHVARYTMDHNDPTQRRVLGEQCCNAFAAGQEVRTYPEENTRCRVCHRLDCDDDCEELRLIYREHQREQLRDLRGDLGWPQ